MTSIMTMMTKAIMLMQASMTSQSHQSDSKPVAFCVKEALGDGWDLNKGTLASSSPMTPGQLLRDSIGMSPKHEEMLREETFGRASLSRTSDQI